VRLHVHDGSSLTAPPPRLEAEQALLAQDPLVRQPCRVCYRHRQCCRRNTLNRYQRSSQLHPLPHSKKKALTKEPILPIPLPPTPLLKFLGKDQERMIRHTLAMMRLPFTLNPHNPDPCRVDTTGDEADDGEDEVDPEVDAQAFGEPDGDGRQEQAEDEADDLGIVMEVGRCPQCRRCFPELQKWFVMLLLK
jgi:hypothetical protein